MSSPATIVVGDWKLYQMPQWPPSHRNRAFLVEKSVSRWGFLDKTVAICICLIFNLRSKKHLQNENHQKRKNIKRETQTVLQKSQEQNKNRNQQKKKGRRRTLMYLLKEEIKGDRGLPVIISLASRPTFQTKTLIER